MTSSSRHPSNCCAPLLHRRTWPDSSSAITPKGEASRRARRNRVGSEWGIQVLSRPLYRWEMAQIARHPASNDAVRGSERHQSLQAVVLNGFRRGLRFLRSDMEDSIGQMSSHFIPIDVRREWKLTEERLLPEFT